MPDSKQEQRAAYIAVLEDVLAASDLITEVRGRLNAVTKDYGDPLNLHSILDGATEPDDERKGPRTQQAGRVRKSYPTQPLKTIAHELVIANPGRTTHQLISAMKGLPLDQQFYDDSMSPVLTELRREGKIVGALCDTERKLKYYNMGSVPTTALVFDKDVVVASMSRAAMMDRARKPTQKETGKGLEVVGPKRRAS